VADGAAEARVDRALVARVLLDDDRRAFEQLMRRHQGMVRAQLRRLLHGDEATADDIAQEVFLLAWRKLDQFRSEARFSTWLHRIAVNTAKNHLVSSNRKPPNDDIEVEDAEQFESGLRLRDNDTPERELMRQQLEQTVLRAVEDLPPELRDAITFREVEGMSYEEIAERMDCPIGTVRSRIFRAREAIDERMKPLLDHDERKRSHA
jgi:RNA polymerase sigma-70 factor (ECF subfamily)